MAGAASSINQLILKNKHRTQLQKKVRAAGEAQSLPDDDQGEIEASEEQWGSAAGMYLPPLETMKVERPALSQHNFNLNYDYEKPKKDG